MDPTTLKSLRILFAAFATGPWLAFATVAVLRTAENSPPATDAKMPVATAVALLATALGAFAARIATTFLIEQSARALPRPDAFAVLARTQVIGQASCELGPLIGAFAWLFDGNPLAVVTPVVGTLAMLRFWPGDARLARIRKRFDATE